MRNVNNEYENLKMMARWPKHKQLPHKVVNMHEGINSKQNIIDPYKWVESITESQDEDFRISEI